MVGWYLSGLLCLPILFVAMIAAYMASAAQMAKHWWKRLQDHAAPLPSTARQQVVTEAVLPAQTEIHPAAAGNITGD